MLSDENGLLVERLSYDAWGKRRYPDGTDDTTGSITSQSTRGFTGEEQLSVAGLVHLNGRVYDPLLARFTSADPTVSDPTNPQGWNRYSYVGNDPLAFTDPNGFSWLSSFFHSVVNFFQTNPIAKAILQIGATAFLNFVLPEIGFAGATLAFAAAAGGAIIATGLSGGNLGQTLKAGLLAGVTALAFYGVGELTNKFPGSKSASRRRTRRPHVWDRGIRRQRRRPCGRGVPLFGSRGRQVWIGRAGGGAKRGRRSRHGRHERRPEAGRERGARGCRVRSRWWQVRQWRSHRCFWVFVQPSRNGNVHWWACSLRSRSGNHNWPIPIWGVSCCWGCSSGRRHCV